MWHQSKEKISPSLCGHISLNYILMYLCNNIYVNFKFKMVGSSFATYGYENQTILQQKLHWVVRPLTVADFWFCSQDASAHLRSRSEARWAALWPSLSGCLSSPSHILARGCWGRRCFISWPCMINWTSVLTKTADPNSQLFTLCISS